MKKFGKASDYYRLRIQQVAQTEIADFDWSDEILYRKPALITPEEKVAYIVQAVDMDSRKVYNLKICARFNKAEAALSNLRDDLNEMTKNRFEEKHFFKN